MPDRNQSHVMAPLSSRQARLVLTYLRGRGNTRDTALWALGISTGLRISDLLSLQVRDILDVSGEVAGRISVVESKSRKARGISLLDFAKQALREHLSGKSLSPSSFIFPSRKGPDAPLTRQQAYRLVRKWCGDCGFKGDFGTHTIRKTYATAAYVATGRDPVATARLTGHSNPAQLLHYIGECGVTEQQAVSQMEKAFSR